MNCHGPPGVENAVDPLEKALISLYWDQIKPSEADIQRRLGELFPGGKFGPDSIKSLVSRGKCVIHLDDDGSRFLELTDTPEWFLGWIGENQEVSSEVWGGFVHFVTCCARRGVGFKGGRYGFAKSIQEMISRKTFPACPECEELFFESVEFCSLGFFCHLVQCGLGFGLIKYEDNMIHPICQCMGASEALAYRLLPPLELGGEDRLQEVGDLIRSVFRKEGISRLPLSQLKRKILSVCGVCLNPAMLGFTKLSDLVSELEGFEVKLIGNNAVLYLRDDECSTAPSSSFR